MVARGPKPVAALKELGVPVTIAVPEPNTWRDLLRTLDEKSDVAALKGRRVAVQEYGASNAELLAGLAERGAQVTRVPVYQWALPEDTGPLRAAVEAIARGEIDVALFTTSIQVAHLLRIAREMNLERELRARFRANPGRLDRADDFGRAARAGFFTRISSRSHPKMGFLVNEAAQRGAELLKQKRGKTAG